MEIEYSRVGVPLKTGRSFVSSSYSRGGEKRRKEGGDMFFPPSPPIMSRNYFACTCHIYFVMLCLRKVLKGFFAP